MATTLKHSLTQFAGKGGEKKELQNGLDGRAFAHSSRVALSAQ
jgi:hypothetical protein